MKYVQLSVSYSTSCFFIGTDKINFFDITLKKCFKRLLGIKTNNPYANQDLYRLWIENNEPKLSEIHEMRKKKFENEPLISIVVPMYNTEMYIEKCIRSIMEQTYKNLEIVIVNDGSTDGCLKICEQLRQTVELSSISFPHSSHLIKAII